jgi:DNA-binding XRE family transcriptional regulator
MSTTELRHSIRSLSFQDQAIALAVPIVADRLMRLSKSDQDDLFALVKELPCAATSEDQFGIIETIIEILDGRAVTVGRADLSESGTQPDKWQKWVEWISKKIREARIGAGLTQEQLAEKTGLPQSHISRIENAKHSPARATIEKIANALDKPVTFFDPS